MISGQERVPPMVRTSIPLQNFRVSHMRSTAPADSADGFRQVKAISLMIALSNTTH